MGKRRPKDNALVAYERTRRVWIYEIIDLETNTPIYVGRSKDMNRRVSQHASQGSECQMLKGRLNLVDWLLKDAMRVVPELPNGVPAYRACEFESFFIIDRKTLFNPPECTHGCNLKHGDRVSGVNLEAIRREIETGFVWPEPEVPEVVVACRAAQAVLADLVDLAADEEPQLCTALTAATIRLHEEERRLLTPTTVAKALALSYKTGSQIEEVDRNDFIRDLNHLRDVVQDQKTPDTCMLQLLRWQVACAKPAGAEWTMLREVAALTLLSISKTLAMREEEIMPKSQTAKDLIQVRNWVFGHSKLRPSTSATKRKDSTDAEEVEEQMAALLKKWKKSTKAQADLKEADFLFRDVEWWDDYAHQDPHEKREKRIAETRKKFAMGWG